MDGTTVRAGQHPAPLDEVHALLGFDGLLAHLAIDHSQPLDRRLGETVAKHAHRVLHGEA